MLRKKSTFDVDIPPLRLPSDEWRETAQKMRDAIKNIPGFADEIRGMLPETPQPTETRGKGGRPRHPVRDEIVVVVCQHLAANSEWSQNQEALAEKVHKDFKGAVSVPEIKNIVRLARRAFPRG
jgi:hypothetical protein